MPHTETIMETKNCKVCNTAFSITDKDLEFYKKISPSFNGEQFDIPSPTCCPSCRQRRRLVFRNERKLYTRKCDATGKNIISIYSPEYKGKVYDQKFWRSDKRDALEYGRDFDEGKRFSEQFGELLKAVPRCSLIGANNYNSDYVNLTADSKDSYLIFESSNNEKCLYGYWLQRCTNCLDTNFSESCENCYEIDNCFRCYKCYHSINLIDCNNCFFCNGCEGCSDCFGCANLHNQKYMIYNTQYTKEEYLNFIQNKKNFSDTKYQEIWDAHPELKQQIKHSEHSTGNYLDHTKHCIECHHGYDAEHCKYSEHVLRNAKYVMDASTVVRDAELVYEAINTAINTFMNIGTMVCWSCSHMYYCDSCFNSKYCFGCTGLRNKEYCIFNKQYTKEEYHQLVPRIIKKMQEDGEWGEFFAPSLSPFGYNETVAMEYYPLTKEEALKLGFNWSDYEAPFPKVDKIVEGSKLWTASCDIIHEQKPELLEKILNYAIKCEVSGKLFRLVKQEIEFYIKHKLPLPRKHPDIRHQERLALRG